MSIKEKGYAMDVKDYVVKKKGRYQIEFCGQVYYLAFWDLMRPLNRQEFEALYGIIKKTRQVLVPIVRDENNNILDGIHRLVIASILKLERDKVPFRVAKGSEAELFEMAKELNASRRHLSPEELKELRAKTIERIVNGRAEGKTIKAIAKEEGKSESAIKKTLDRVQMYSVPHRVRNSDQIKGSDGKSYPLKKKKSTEKEQGVLMSLKESKAKEESNKRRERECSQASFSQWLAELRESVVSKRKELNGWKDCAEMQGDEECIKELKNCFNALSGEYGANK